MTDNFPSHILCPVDFSERSSAALQIAAQFASSCGAAITAFHAYWFDLPPYFTPSRAQKLRDQFNDAASGLRDALRRFLDTAGVPNADILVEEGDAASSILRTALALPAGLVILGTHGRRGFQRFLLGSASERLLRMSSIPILTVRGPHHPFVDPTVLGSTTLWVVRHSAWPVLTVPLLTVSLPNVPLPTAPLPNGVTSHDSPDPLR